MNLFFASKVQRRHRQAVENLFFMNPRQYRVREGIINTLNKFGQPWLEEIAGEIYLRVGKNEVQTLFAFDGNFNEHKPVGVVVYLRNTDMEIAILHLAVDPDYGFNGEQKVVGLGILLVDKVKAIAARIVGIKRVILCYRREIVMTI